MEIEKKYRVLLVEDDESFAALAQEILSISGEGRFDVRSEPDLASAKTALEAETFAAVVLDLDLPDSRGIETFKKIQRCCGSTPICGGVLFSGSATARRGALTLRRINRLWFRCRQALPDVVLGDAKELA